MSNDARVSALEELLQRVRRNSQAPRASRELSASVGAAISAANGSSWAQGPVPSGSQGAELTLDPLDGVDLETADLDTADLEAERPTPPPPSAGSLDGISLQRRGTPQPGSVRGASPRPPTPPPPANALTRSDSSPLHDAVISHTAASPETGRIESGFGLVPPPPRRPSSMPDFVDEPTATGDPDEAEQLLLAEQEEAARARVRFPTPVPNRPPTPLPPPLTLREPARTGKPILELDLDPSSVAEPTRPFGYRLPSDRPAERRSAPVPGNIPTSSFAESGALIEPDAGLAGEAALGDGDLDGAKTDRPPASNRPVELPPMSAARLPNLDAIESHALGPTPVPARPPSFPPISTSPLAIDDDEPRTMVAAAAAEAFEPLFDVPSIETRTSRPPAQSVRPSAPPPVVDEIPPAPAIPRAEPTLREGPDEAADVADAVIFDAPTFDAPSVRPPSPEPAPPLTAIVGTEANAVEANAAHARPASTPPSTSSPSTSSPSTPSPSTPSPSTPPPPVSAPPPSAPQASTPPAPVSAEEVSDVSPSSSRQLRDEVRPIDDKFEGFGPVGESEPPPESGEVPSQPYRASESPSAGPPASDRQPRSAPPARVGSEVAFESPPTEDEAPSGVVVARISSAPTRVTDEPSVAGARPISEPPPVSNPMGGTPPKPARVDRAPADIDLEGTPHPVDIDEIVRASYGEITGKAPEEATAELLTVGRVDVVQRTSTHASGPVAVITGTRNASESFGAILDAALEIGR